MLKVLKVGGLFNFSREILKSVGRCEGIALFIKFFKFLCPLSMGWGTCF